LPSSRYFFAVWPPAATADALAQWAKSLEGRGTPAAKIHLTLAFLGAVAHEKAIVAARRAEGRSHELPIERTGYWKHNRIVWAGPRETPPALAALVESLHLELYRAEYILERRPYAAHVTLARGAAPPRALAPLPKVEWPVAEFTLVRSTNSAKGSVYELLERFRLLE
jgi:RNA 2',3'-cyclic 3'-phosphodiesterase